MKFYDEPEHKALRAELEVLNEEVRAAMVKRAVFLDANMAKFAEFQIGDEVVNVTTGSVGVVCEHYRFQAKQNPIYDTGFNVDFRVRLGTYIDNSSRFAGLHPFVLEADRKARTDTYLRAVELAARRH